MRGPFVKGLLVAVAVILLTATVGGMAAAKKKPRGKKGGPVASATLIDAEGRAVGKVKFFRARPRFARDKLVVTALASGLSPGFHGFHVHAVGKCEPAAPGGPFVTAGGHLNLGNAGHGAHAGDMPVLLVIGNGTASATFLTDRLRLQDLLDADGSAVVVHAAADNYANIPTRYRSDAGGSGPDAATLATGDSGGRVACGVIRARRR